MYLKASANNKIFCWKNQLVSWGFGENMLAIISLQCLTAICLHPGGWKE